LLAALMAALATPAAVTTSNSSAAVHPAHTSDAAENLPSDDDWTHVELLAATPGSADDET
jgi:hypothetical protein